MSSLTQLIKAEERPLFIGFTISLGLYGTTLSQTIFYFQSFPDDNRAIKYLVCFLCAADTFYTYLLGHMYWNFSVKGRIVGLSVLIDNVPWQLSVSFATTFFIISVVQSFFAVRVWNLSHKKNWLVTVIICIFDAGQFASGMVFVNHLMKTKSAIFVFDRDIISAWSARMQLICNIVCDLAISASQVYYFFVFRANMDRFMSRHILQYLIIISVNMGVLLCLVSIVTIILFQIESASLICLCPQFILSKLYVNSLLATLNSRRHFRALANKTVELTLSTIPTTIGAPLSEQDSDA